jgi:hypothetical protein
MYFRKDPNFISFLFVEAWWAGMSGGSVAQHSDDETDGCEDV